MAGSYTTTTNFGLHVLLGTSKVSDVDEGFAKLAGDVDAKMLGYSQDTLAKRPAAGVPNRYFKATDTGVVFHDTGTVWEPMLRASAGTGTLSWTANVTSNEVIIAHGLPAVPTGVVATVGSWGSYVNQPTTAQVVSMDATNIHFRGEKTTQDTTTAAFFWIAFL